jgi:hypothetical protein
MATTTTAQICDAIESTLGAAAGVSRSESYDELSDGVTETPTLQVYWESTEEDISGSTDRTSFRAGMRQDEHLFHGDLYVRQRSHIGEDMQKLVEMKDAIDAVLVAQTDKPYFGLAGIQAFHWRAERVTFVYGDPQIPYVGIRYYITIRTF